MDFDKETLNTTKEDYLKKLCKTFNPIAITTGFNHTFGKQGLGTSQTLEDNQFKYGYKYFQIPAKTINGVIVSSSAIRTKLLSGDIKSANAMLGRNFMINGTIIKGAQLGRKLGFPTANLVYPMNIINIPYGAYVVETELDNQKFKGVMNFGIKPTLDNKHQIPLAEVHIINFNNDIYGKNITIKINNFIRTEQKFNSLEELKTQIEKDIQVCLKS